MRRRRLLLVAVVVAVGLAGCTGGDGTTTAPATPTPNGTTPTETTPPGDGPGTATPTSTPTPTPVDADPQAVKSRAIEALRAVDTYRLVANLTAETRSNNVQQTSHSEQTYVLDRSATAFQRTLVQQVRGRTIESATYLVDGTVYSRSQANVQRYGGAWVENEHPENVTELFDSVDELATTRALLANASVSLAGARTVGGVDTYVLDATVSPDTYAAVNDLGNTTTVAGYDATYYVAQDSGRLQRVALGLNWTRTPQGTELDQHITGTYDISYDETDVTLPDAADSAVPIGTNDSEGNETDAGDETDTGSETDTGDETDTDGEADGPGIDVREGSLAVDPTATFHRVERALATNVSDPAAVIIQAPLNASTGGTDDGPDQRTLAQVVGFRSAGLLGENVSVAGYDLPYRWVAEVRVSGFGNVHLRSPAGAPRPFVRLLSTHEFVHYVQLQNGRWRSVNVATDSTTDGTYARRAVLEGAATFTTNHVFAADNRTLRNTDLYRGIDAALPADAIGRYANSWYPNGAAYVESRIDDPAALESVYANPPTTSEQVLHGLAPSAEPPATLSVSVESEDYAVAGRDRMGEAYLRYALETTLPADRAAAAAAGWGNDTAMTLRPDDGNSSFVWVHRWDDDGEASEFAAAARAFLDARENGVPGQLRRPSDRTTALVFGPQRLQDDVSVHVDGEDVTVDAP